MDTITKLKRQVRDYYNKHANDKATIEEVAKVIGFPLPDNMKICVWPDGIWCFQEDVETYSWMSDDYSILSVPVEFAYDEVETLVAKFNREQQGDLQ
jgi:hypothetical protein